MTGISGEVLVVTGGGGDIGLATARRAAGMGASVALVDIDRAKVEAAAATLADDGLKAAGYACDVIDMGEVDRTLAAITDDLGPVRMLFNNAGYQGRFAMTSDYPADDFGAVLAVNVQGVFHVLRAAAARMIDAGGGAIVNTASMAGVDGPPNMIAYAASKSAVIGMTRTASKDLAPHGIRVNAISPAYMGPGYMWTRQVEHQAAVGSQYFSADPAEVAEEMISRVPMRRYGSIDEIPGVVTFLLGDDASYLTGVNIPITGGI